MLERLGIAGARGLHNLAALAAAGALQRGPAAVRLDAARVRAGAPRTFASVRVDHHVAELGATAGGAAEDLPVDDHAAADAGAQREHHQLLGTDLGGFS